MRLTKSCKRSERRAPSTTFAPRSASRRAVASPIPLLAPVITTTLSSSLGMILLFLSASAHPGQRLGESWRDVTNAGWGERAIPCFSRDHWLPPPSEGRIPRGDAHPGTRALGYQCVRYALVDGRAFHGHERSARNRARRERVLGMASERQGLAKWAGCAASQATGRCAPSHFPRWTTYVPSRHHPGLDDTECRRQSARLCLSERRG